ncbi:hypothetical protein CF328_g5662, partial [Tilletia controversa]
TPAPAHRYSTRPDTDRRQPVGLAGFVVENEAGQQQPSSSQAQVPRPRPRPYDPSLHVDSEDSDDERRATPSTTQLRKSAPNKATFAGRASSSASAQSKVGKKTPSLKGTVLKTPKITTAFSPSSSRTTLMGPPPPPPPSSQQIRAPQNSDDSNTDTINGIGSTVEHPIDFTDGEDSQTTASSSSSHMRKDGTPAAALDAAVNVWRRAHKDADDKRKAAEEGKEWIPSGPVSRDINRVFKGMTDAISAQLSKVKGCFHLAIDVWTSANGYAFLGLIVCYQDSGCAVRRLLEMIPFLDQHDGVHLADATHDILKKYGIADRLWNIVSDNASENTTMMRLLSAKGGLPRFKMDGEVNCRVRCSAHVLNLISKAVLKAFTAHTAKKKTGTKTAQETYDGKDVGGSQSKDDEAAIEDDDVEEGDDWDVDAEDDFGDLDEPTDDEDADAVVDSDELDNTRQPIEEEDDLDISTALHPEVVVVQEDDEAINSILQEQDSSKRSPRVQKELDTRNKQIGLGLRKLAWLASQLRYSPTKRRKFQADCVRMSSPRPHTLLRDVATRWDSTHNMLGRGLDLWDGIIAFTERADSPVPKDKRLKRSDEADLRKIFELLKPLANATLKFSSKLSPTISEVIGLFEDIDYHFSALQTSEEDLVWQEAATRGQLVNAKYYGLTEQADVYVLAILLHPNYRAEYMKVHKWPRDWQNKAVKILRSVFGSHYEIKIEDAEPTPGSQTDDFNQLDKTTQALMRLAKEKQKSVPIHDAVDDWLGGITMVQIENGKPVYVDPLRW